MPTLQQWIQGIRDRARHYGGAYVPYSQCVEPTNTLIKSMNATSGGICRALAAKWIAEHARGDSLWNWLCVPGTTWVKQSAIINLMVNFNEGVHTSGSLSNPTVSNPDGLGGGLYQNLVMQKYLGLYGLIKRNITKDIITGVQQRTPGVNVGHSIANRLSPKWMATKSGTYVHLYTGGGGSAHSTAAWVGASDIAFFDPNFGEFYFTDYAKFRQFFVDFWQMSGYVTNWGVFWLEAYAKKI